MGPGTFEGRVTKESFLSILFKGPDGCGIGSEGQARGGRLCESSGTDANLLVSCTPERALFNRRRVDVIRCAEGGQ